MANDPPAVEAPDSPHYPISAPVRQKIQRCYEHGSNLVSVQDDYDFDYANTMFTECVSRDPNNLVYVEAFLENLQRKYKNNKRGARTLGFGGGKGPFKKAAAKEDWEEVLKRGPGLLKTNPWDVLVLRAMAQACRNYHYNEVELRYLKNALDANPKDADVNRHCAQSLARMGQFDQAIACWHRVEEAKGRNDPEAPKMISELTIEKARARAGYADATPGGAANSAPSKATSGVTAPEQNAGADPPPASTESTEDPAEAAASKRREIQLTPRQKLERAIVEFPTEVGNYLKLADLHMHEHRFADGEKVLAKALSASGGDIKIRERLEDATVLRMKHQLQIAEKRAEVKQTDEARELAEQIRSNLYRLEMEIWQSRAQRYPDQQALKYQLGKRLRKLGRLPEAIEQFEAVQDDPRVLAAARLELGECRQSLKQYPQALLAYQQAIDASETSTRAEIRKLCLYRAGVLAGALRQLDTARRYLGQLVELESSYKDAQARLDKMSRMGHKQ